MKRTASQAHSALKFCGITCGEGGNPTSRLNCCTVSVLPVESRLNEGGLLSGTFFGRTNYPVDYDDLFKPLTQ